ncbi:MAG: PSD1 and planctomycete cytochrome C domain-containing protein [Gemmataceae bacterium]
MHWHLCWIAVFLFGIAPTFAFTQEIKQAKQAKFFDSKVKPILKALCFSWHGGGRRVRGGLNLTTREALLEGGDEGKVIDLKHPEKSRLLDAINHGELKMPPRGKLPQSQLNVLTEWVNMGAPFSAAKAVAHGPPKVDAQAKNWWSFRPVRQPDIPKVTNTKWVRNPIDSFVLAKLESKGLKPSLPAKKVELLRRVTYDLVGLPPTPQEVKDFLADKSPNAYEKVVERLLKSPHYGERWARHWLDLVRYAETNSFERDNPKPYVWRYRDYVIKSFNQDKPYNQFIREQLAGDELDKVTAESIIATGYYRLGLWDDEPADPTLAFYDGLDDVIMTTGQVFLGLTINCARCHDHKIDPFPQKDYYRFLAFFHGVKHYGSRSPRSVEAASVRTVNLAADLTKKSPKIAEYKRQVANLEKQKRAIEEKVAPKLQGGEIDDFKYPSNRLPILRKAAGKLLSNAEFQKYEGVVASLEKLEKKRPTVMAKALCVTEIGRKARDTFVLVRGSPQAKGERVEPGFPSVLTDEQPEIPDLPKDVKTSGRRRVLADWIASPKNPLTWRVVVNRVWQYHFGRGLVRSTSDFGFQGTPPTHPQLLDWLASRFAKSGRFKELHRFIVLSNTYRMSSRSNKEGLAKDTENDLFWRFDPRRLAAEEIRDSILAVSGNINLKKMYGPSIFPKIPKEVLAGQSRPGAGWRPSPPQEAARRSVYIHIKRSLAVPLLAVFDAADTDGTCPVRFTTTQPTQALGMLNGEFINEQASIFATHVKKKVGDNAKDQVREILWRTCQRKPSAEEIARGVQFMNNLTAGGTSRSDALKLYCLLALNLNEFVFLD